MVRVVDERHQIRIYWFIAKYAAVMSNIKYWLARNKGNVFEWSDMSTFWLNVLIWYKSGISSSNSNVIGSRNEIAEQIAILAVVHKIAGVFLIGLNIYL
jgi:hypothetical protein